MVKLPKQKLKVMSRFKKKKLLFVIPNFSSFILKDLSLLKKHFDLRIEHFSGLKKAPISLPRLLIGVIWSDLTFSRFADIHAFFAVLISKIYKRKSIVVVGGYEVAKVTEIDYGLMLSPFFSRVVKYILERADQVLTVDESLKRDAIINANVTGQNIMTVPNGYNSEIWRFKGKKDDTVITVANIKHENIKRKGLETFVEAAKFLPEVKFIIIGRHIDQSANDLKLLAPPNVEFPGHIPHQQLVTWYSRAKV